MGGIVVKAVFKNVAHHFDTVALRDFVLDVGVDLLFVDGCFCDVFVGGTFEVRKVFFASTIVIIGLKMFVFGIDEFALD
jgi:hypothetical protein